MKKSTIAALAGAGALTIGNAIHAAVFKPAKEATAIIDKTNLNVERYRKNLSKAITFKTIAPSTEAGTADWSEFEKFHKFIDEAYPLVAQKLEKEIVPPMNLVYRWKGKNDKLDPIALCAHQDVVPVTEGTEADWTNPAFEGIDDGEFIWGRGALDMKNHLICVLESVESLLEEGFEPERDVYLLFGDNEEIVACNDNGAGMMAELLRDRGIHLDSVLDEGGAMLPVNVPGVINNKVLAGIGLAEKGYADIVITINAKGGHSSQPPKHTALGQMAEVIRDLENNQFKSNLSSSMKSLLVNVGKNCTYPVRLVTCNMKLLFPAVMQILKLIPPGACMIRTTTGVTQAVGSPAPNVLPQRASITVNFRAMPGCTIDDIIAHIRKVVRNKNIEIEVKESKEASIVSSTDSRAYKIIERLAKGIEPNAIVAPFLVMGGTDAYHYEICCENIYRYAPFKVDTGLLLCTHGTNERIPVACMGDALAFFKAYIKESSDEI